MAKFYLFAGLYFLSSFLCNAQKVTPEQINFKQLAQFESAHPEMFGICRTCPKKEEERDKGWRELANDLPLPAGAVIKTQALADLRPATPISPTTPLSPSPQPNQTFPGYIDPGNGIPPDTHGAVGTNHVVTATNDFVKIHTKTGAIISSVAISTFTGISACDPYIKYDPGTNRWFYSAIECSGNNGNKVVVLVSQTGDPTADWFRYSFIPALPDGAFFMDHPYLGFNDRWLVVSGRRFPNGIFAGPVIFLLDKAKLLASQPVTFGVDAQVIDKTAADGDAPLPVTVSGSNPAPGTCYVLQNWNGNTGGVGLIRLSTVTGDIPNAVWNTSFPGAVFPSSPEPWISETGNSAEQSGEQRRVSTNDARISTAVMVNGNIWCAHHVGVTGSNIAVQWWELDGRPGNSFGSVLQRGRIGAGLNNNYRYFPGIAVNNTEDVIIGYTVSSNTSRISCGYSIRSNATAPNTMDDEVIYKVGLSTYYKDFGSGRARWGDYSHSAVDPDDGSLWTIQEYADQRLGTTDNDSRFGVWWAQVIPTSASFRRDASIGAVIEPTPGLICKNPVTVTVSIKNLGTDTLKTVEIGMILDNVDVGTAATITNLRIPAFAVSAPQTITPSFNPVVGNHIFQVYTKNPNGNTDDRASNDTTTITFTMVPELSSPYTEDFTVATFPPANGSAVINPDGPGAVTWTKSNLAGRPAAPSLKMSCFGYQAIGQRDIYRTSKINSSILDSVVISFNVAYQQYLGIDGTGPSHDSLKILYSPDCGTNWYPANYAKGGAGLSTVSGTTSESFIPANAGQWRTERTVLKDLCGNSPNTVMIGFEAYNDFGNNIYIDSINIVGFRSATRNAFMKSVSKPLPALCVQGYTPEITFGNAGMDTIKTLKINYRLDNGAVSTVNWTGSLARCGEANLVLPAGTAPVGTHVLTVYTSDPNGTNDEVTVNDTLRWTFSVFAPVSTPIFEGFESNNFPTENWGVQNVNGGITFERSLITAKTGAGSLVINNADNRNFNGATDYFVSPVVQNSITFDSVFVDFDLAYKPGGPYPGSSIFPQDTLEILSTTDCGASFSSVWKKWGNELQTISDTNSVYDIPFTPRSTEWRKIRAYLTPFVGSANFQVYLTMRGNKQNSLWLDNINITSQILPQRLKNQGYLVYPNPFNHSFLIHHYAVEPPVDLRSVQIFNSAGQLVWGKRYNGNAERQIIADLKNAANGMYVLKMIYSGKTIVERIIKH